MLVSDGGAKVASGLRRGSVKVFFGERSSATASAVAGGGAKGKQAIAVRVRHAYSHSGRFLLRVKARDRAGNTTRLKQTVRVR